MSFNEPITEETLDPQDWRKTAALAHRMIDAESLVRSGDDHDPATVVHHYLAVNLARRLMNMTRLMRDADF